MTELKLHLAHNTKSFQITADSEADVADTPALELEGHVLANLLFTHLPGGTIVAMFDQLRVRYGKLSNQELNPFKDGER